MELSGVHTVWNKKRYVIDYLQFILKSLALLCGTIIIMIYDYVFYLFLIELP